MMKTCFARMDMLSPFELTIRKVRQFLEEAPYEEEGCAQLSTGQEELALQKKGINSGKLELSALAYDVSFLLSLAEALPTEEPARKKILDVLEATPFVRANENALAAEEARECLRSALADWDGKLRHTMMLLGSLPGASSAEEQTIQDWQVAITAQLALIEHFPEYVFLFAHASRYEWLEGRQPLLFQRVAEAIEAGQWEPMGSLWADSSIHGLGGEAIVRQILYGTRYFESRFPQSEPIFWLDSAHSLTPSLPQILKRFGRTLLLTQGPVWGSKQRRPPCSFWWLGVDGSKVWVHVCASCKGTPQEILESIGCDGACADRSLKLLVGEGPCGPAHPQLEMLRRARNAPFLPVIESHKRPGEFFRDALAKDKGEEIWAGECCPGPSSPIPPRSNQTRTHEFLLRDAELLACFTDSFPRRYPQETLEKAWKSFLLEGSHEPAETWPIERISLMSILLPLIEKTLKRIGDRLDTSGMARPIALFQNATVASQGEIPWREAETPVSIVIGREALPVQRVEGEKPYLIFPMPQAALGSVCVADLSDQAPTLRIRLKAGARKMENGELLLRFDQNGNISSIRSLDDRPVEFIEPGKLANFFQVIEDESLGGGRVKDWAKSERFEIVERGPVRVAAEIIKRFGQSTLRQRISLGPTPGVRFDTEMDWREEDKALKVSFPIHVNAFHATYEIPFGNCEHPTHSNVGEKQSSLALPALKWMDLSEGGHGAALLSNGLHGYSIQDNVMSLTLARGSLMSSPAQHQGSFRFTYQLLPHFDSYRHADVVASAYALNAPLRWVKLEPGPGESGQLPKFISCENRNLVVETVKKAEDSNRIVARLYECHNTRGTAELFCARGIRSAWLVGLDEKPYQELEVHDGLAVFDYRPFEILTILVEP